MKVQTSNEQNLQDIPFYTLLIFSSTFSSTGTFNFSSAGTFNFSSARIFNFSSAGTFLHLNAISTVPDRCYPFKVQTSNEQNLQDIPFYTLLIFSSTFSSAGTFNFSSAGTFNFSSTRIFNFSSAGTFLHLNAISTVPDRCYPFKVQTSNEQNLQNIPFYTLLIFSSAFSSAGTFNFSSAGTINFSSAGNFDFSSAFSSAGNFNFSFAGTFLHLNA